jgi:hypothetical protein
MKKTTQNIFYIKGNLYINRPGNAYWLSPDKNAAIIHVKRDVIFGCFEPPNRMKSNDYFLDVDKFAPHIYDIVAFSKL